MFLRIFVVNHFPLTNAKHTEAKFPLIADPYINVESILPWEYLQYLHFIYNCFWL